MSEHRQYPRVHTMQDTIYFVEDDTQERMHYCGTLTDLSDGGVGMDVVTPHRPHDTLWLEGIRGLGSPVAAVVRWVKACGDSFHVGLEFAQQRSHREARESDYNYF